jgi:transposase
MKAEIKNINIEDLQLLYNAYIEYSKEKELYNVAWDIECESRAYTAIRLNNAYNAFNALLKKKGLTYNSFKSIINTNGGLIA